jgi:hypothetical protein
MPNTNFRRFPVPWTVFLLAAAALPAASPKGFRLVLVKVGKNQTVIIRGLDDESSALGDVDPLCEFGYVGTMGAFIEMCRSRVMPVDPEETGALARELLAARESAAAGRPVILS